MMSLGHAVKVQENHERWARRTRYGNNHNNHEDSQRTPRTSNRSRKTLLTPSFVEAESYGNMMMTKDDSSASTGTSFSSLPTLRIRNGTGARVFPHDPTKGNPAEERDEHVPRDLSIPDPNVFPRFAHHQSQFLPPTRSYDAQSLLQPPTPPPLATTTTATAPVSTIVSVLADIPPIVTKLDWDEKKTTSEEDLRDISPPQPADASPISVLDMALLPRPPRQDDEDDFSSASLPLRAPQPRALPSDDDDEAGSCASHRSFVKRAASVPVGFKETAGGVLIPPPQPVQHSDKTSTNMIPPPLSQTQSHSIPQTKAASRDDPPSPRAAVTQRAIAPGTPTTKPRAFVSASPPTPADVAPSLMVETKQQSHDDGKNEKATVRARGSPQALMPEKTRFRARGSPQAPMPVESTCKCVIL